MDARVGNQADLELVDDVDLERTLEAEGDGERGDDLRNQPVQVAVRRARYMEFGLADIIESLGEEEQRQCLLV